MIKLNPRKQIAGCVVPWDGIKEAGRQTPSDFKKVLSIGDKAGKARKVANATTQVSDLLP